MGSGPTSAEAPNDLIRTPDQRLRVFVSSTLQELGPERVAVRAAIDRLRLSAVMFELGGRPHPPRQVYQSCLAQSQVFVGVYWQRYGWVAPGEEVSGPEDEYALSAGMPRLIYVKSPAPDTEARLNQLLSRIRDDDDVSYRGFSSAAELQRLVEDDLAVLLSERFDMTLPSGQPEPVVPQATAWPLPPTPLVGREQDSEAIADSPDAAPDVIDALSSLVDSSLVRQENRDGEPRFGLLETVREYALSRLSDGPDWREAHERHAAYFLAFAEQAWDLAAERGWLDRLEIEHGNLGAAMVWLAEQDELEPAVRLAWVTWRFWYFRGHAPEWAGYGERILARSERLPPTQLALALCGTGLMQIAAGEEARAEALLEQSLPLFREADYNFGIGLAASTLGHLAALHHEEARATELLEESLARQEELGSDAAALVPFTGLNFQRGGLISLDYNFLGQIALSQGDARRATELFSKGLDAPRRSQERFTVLISLYDLALSRQTQGELVGAASLLHEGLSLWAEAGDQASIASKLRSSLGETAFAQAQAEGGEMRRRQAVEYALTEERPPGKGADAGHE